MGLYNIRTFLYSCFVRSTWNRTCFITRLLTMTRTSLILSFTVFRSVATLWVLYSCGSGHKQLIISITFNVELENISNLWAKLLASWHYRRFSFPMEGRHLGQTPIRLSSFLISKYLIRWKIRECSSQVMQKLPRACSLLKKSVMPFCNLQSSVYPFRSLICWNLSEPSFAPLHHKLTSKKSIICLWCCLWNCSRIYQTDEAPSWIIWTVINDEPRQRYLECLQDHKPSPCDRMTYRMIFTILIYALQSM